MANLIDRLEELISAEEKRRALPTVEPGDLNVAQAHALLIPHGKRFHIDFSLKQDSDSAWLEWRVWTYEPKTTMHGNGQTLRSAVEAALASWAKQEAEQPQERADDPIIAADQSVDSIRPVADILPQL